MGDKHMQNDDKENTQTCNSKTTKEAYFEQLDAWVKMANFSQNAMGMFPWFLMQMVHTQATDNDARSFTDPNYGALPPHFPIQNRNQQLQTESGNNNNNNIIPNNNTGNNNTIGFNAIAPQRFVAGLRILDSNGQIELIHRNGGFDYIIAPFWKRAVAEVIDAALLLVVKVFITFILMNFLEMDWALDLDKEVLRKAIDDDDYTSFFVMTMDFLAFSTDLIVLELVMKVLVCLYESYMIKTYGCTLGKAVMKLRVYYVEAVLPLPQQQPGGIPFQALAGFQPIRVETRALIYPAEKPTFKRALIRTIAKSFIITLLFPMCFIMVFFKNNRAVYDVITKTVVVEDNQNPQFRIPPPQQQPQEN